MKAGRRVAAALSDKFSCLIDSVRGMVPYDPRQPRHPGVDTRHFAKKKNEPYTAAGGHAGTTAPNDRVMSCL